MGPRTLLPGTETLTTDRVSQSVGRVFCRSVAQSIERVGTEYSIAKNKKWNVDGGGGVCEWGPGFYNTCSTVPGPNYRTWVKRDRVLSGSLLGPHTHVLPNKVRSYKADATLDEPAHMPNVAVNDVPNWAPFFSTTYSRRWYMIPMNHVGFLPRVCMWIISSLHVVVGGFKRQTEEAKWSNAIWSDPCSWVTRKFTVLCRDSGMIYMYDIQVRIS